MKYLLIIIIALVGCIQKPTSTGSGIVEQKYNNSGEVIKSSFEWCAEEKELISMNSDWMHNNDWLESCATEVTEEIYIDVMSQFCKEGGFCNPNGVEL